MTVRTILACLTTERHSPAILAVAKIVARRTNAHMIGLHTLEAIMLDPNVDIFIPDNVYANFKEAQAEQSAAIKEIFDSEIGPEDFPSEWRELQAPAAYAADRMIETAHVSDLVVMAKPDMTEERQDQRHAQEEVIRGAGRPVLLVPHDATEKPVGENVLIGWSPTKEAARAVHEALALTAPGARVTVLTVTKEPNRPDPVLKELARMLDRHGLNVEVVYRPPTDGSIVDTLLKEAFERGADLIVTGAFGHSRLYDFAIGAVTLDLMRKADRPVLFST